MTTPLFDEQRIHSLQDHCDVTASELNRMQAKLCTAEEFLRVFAYQLTENQPNWAYVHDYFKRSVAAMTKLEQKLIAAKQRLHIELNEAGVDPLAH